MYDVSDKVFMWEGYREMANKLASIVEDDYCFKLARYGKTRDKDADKSRKLYETMYDVVGYIDDVLQALNAEWDIEEVEATGIEPEAVLSY